MWRLVLLLAVLPGLAPAQDLVEAMTGRYGSASDPAGSCALNPHELQVMAQPPHLFLTWAAPWTDATGKTISNRHFDILAWNQTGFTLRDEDERQVTDAGRPLVWILRRTKLPQGYCWGRTDWPQMRCEDQQLRCDTPVS